MANPHVSKQTKVKEQAMTAGQKYRMIVKSADEYLYKMPHDVAKVELVKTGREDYPEIVRSH